MVYHQPIHNGLKILFLSCQVLSISFRLCIGFEKKERSSDDTGCTNNNVKRDRFGFCFNYILLFPISLLFILRARSWANTKGLCVHSLTGMFSLAEFFFSPCTCFLFHTGSAGLHCCYFCWCLA